MAKKLYDLAVVVSTYQDRQTGENKNRYQNVGAVMQSEDGGKFLMLEAWFNPAGVPRREGSSSVLVSMFAPKDANGQPQGGGNGGGARQQQAPRQGGQTQHGQAKSNGYVDDDTPF